MVNIPDIRDACSSYMVALMAESTRSQVRLPAYCKMLYYTVQWRKVGEKLKGQCHEMINPLFFHLNNPSGPIIFNYIFKFAKIFGKVVSLIPQSQDPRLSVLLRSQKDSDNFWKGQFHENFGTFFNLDPYFIEDLLALLILVTVTVSMTLQN